jgi:hypothetical protein
MAEDLMNYPGLVERAMRGVVREALVRAAKDGLPGAHHLYITFRTRDDGVHIADRLIAQYPEEMTIVLQYQFWGLEVTPDFFEVTLSFSGKNERLHIPFDSVVGFADPSVNFGLQFKPVGGTLTEDVSDEELERELEELADLDADGNGDGDPEAAAPAAPDAGADDDAPKSGEVVALDAFRKKKT